MPNCNIWDEPLNYLDVFNQEQLEQLILEKQTTYADRRSRSNISQKK